MKTTGLVLKSRDYRTIVEPPAALEDESRFRNDGVFTNVTWVRLPSGLWVMEFNGSSSRVTIPNLDLSGYKTVEIIAIPNFASNENPTKDYFFFDWQIDGNNYTNFTREATSLVTSFRYMVQGGVDSAYCSALINWLAGEPLLFHLIMNPGGTFHLYLNAVVQASDGCTLSLASSKQTMYIGVGVGLAPNEYFDGLIAPPRIYDYILNLAAIQARLEAVRAWLGI